MSNRNLPPIPRLEDEEFLGVAQAKNGDIGARFRFAASGTVDLMSERFLYNDMIKAAEWSRDLRTTLPDWSAFYAEASKRQNEILALVQREKVRRGVPLDTPEARIAEVIQLTRG